MRVPRVHGKTAAWLAIVFAALLLVSGCDGSSSDETSPGDVTMSEEALAGKAVFDEKCAACHTIGGGQLVGPDLAGIAELRDSEWLYSWIDDPAAFAELDSDAGEIFTGAMPALGLSGDEIDNVLAYLEATSGVEADTAAPEGPRELSDAEFEAAAGVFFNRCAGCHGTLRAGATGPAILPDDRTLEIGTAGIQKDLMVP